MYASELTIICHGVSALAAALVGWPDVVQRFHDILIECEDDGHVKTHTTQPWSGALVETEENNLLLDIRIL